MTQAGHSQALPWILALAEQSPKGRQQGWAKQTWEGREVLGKPRLLETSQQPRPLGAGRQILVLVALLREMCCWTRGGDCTSESHRVPSLPAAAQSQSNHVPPLTPSRVPGGPKRLF